MACHRRGKFITWGGGGGFKPTVHIYRPLPEKSKQILEHDTKNDHLDFYYVTVARDSGPVDSKKIIAVLRESGRV